MEYKKILAALDNSALSQTVFEQALNLAQQNQAQLKLFHCLSYEDLSTDDLSIPHSETFSDFARQIRQKQGNSQQRLTEYVQLAKEKGVETDWTCCFGSPGSEIRKLAESWEADLIVIGRRGISGLAKIFVGSVSNYVINHTSCSIHLINE